MQRGGSSVGFQSRPLQGHCGYGNSPRSFGTSYRVGLVLRLLMFLVCYAVGFTDACRADVRQSEIFDSTLGFPGEGPSRRRKLGFSPRSKLVTFNVDTVETIAAHIGDVNCMVSIRWRCFSLDLSIQFPNCFVVLLKTLRTVCSLSVALMQRISLWLWWRWRNRPIGIRGRAPPPYVCFRRICRATSGTSCDPGALTVKPTPYTAIRHDFGRTSHGTHPAVDLFAYRAGHDLVFCLGSCWRQPSTPVLGGPPYLDATGCAAAPRITSTGDVDEVAALSSLAPNVACSFVSTPTALAGVPRNGSVAGLLGLGS